MRDKRVIITYALCFILASVIGLTCTRMTVLSFGFAEDNHHPPVDSPLDPTTSDNQTHSLQKSPDVQQSSQNLQSQPVTVHEPVHFVGMNDEDVLLHPGSYSLRAAGELSLEILSTDPGKNLVIRASTTMHELEVGDAIALSLKDGDEQHLLLYLPGGKGLDAVGSASAVRPRATTLTPLSTSRTNELLSVSTPTLIPTLDVSLPSVQMVIDGLATPAGREQINLTAGVRITIETTAITSGDPVLHLLSVRGDELAYDDNSAGGSGAKLIFTPQVTGPAVIVVRSRTQTTGGRCDLLLNGSVWRRSVPFGGWHVSLPGLRANEEIETIQTPSGHGGSHYIYILRADALGIEKSYGGGGTGYGSNFRLATNLGSRVAVVSVLPLGNFPNEPIRIIRNDVALSGHDPDQDGLGSELEAAIGTCSAKTGFANNFDCNQTTDPRDTDGDGINDRWELLGRRDATPHQLLPVWGADPRHKDLFFEVDFMQRAPGEATQRMSPDVARKFASYYQDEVGSSIPLLKAYHAVVLRNPDGLPGIRVHLDTGLPPQIPADVTLYGNWGGHNTVPPVRNSDGNWEGHNYLTAWETQLAPARRGIFRYLLPYTGRGGQNRENVYACTGPITDSVTLAHECAHAMGLGHSGPTRASGDVDPNCKPNYPSLINYAFSDGVTGFSDGTGAPSLNNWALKEWNALAGASPAYISVLEDPNLFKYWVDRANGHVDWNRDGVIAPAGTTVRAYANYRHSSSCEYTRYNQSQIGGAQSNRAPAMGRLGNRLYVFYSEGGPVKYAISTSTWNCPLPSITPCGSWYPERDAGLNGAGGVAVERIRTGTQDALLVVTIDQQGRLWERKVWINPVQSNLADPLASSPPSPEDNWSGAALIPNSSPASGEPSVETFNGIVYLVYKGADGKIRFNRLVPDTGWAGEQLALSSAGTEIVSAPFASPGIVRAYLQWKPGRGQLYGAFPDMGGKLDIWWFNSGTSRWEKTDMFETRPDPISGRPALAWVPYQTGAYYPGRLYMLYSKYNSDPKIQHVRMMMSYVINVRGPLPDTTNTQMEKIGLDSTFDNGQLFAYGIDLLYEPGFDSNLRAALSFTEAMNSYGVWVRPKADGINDFSYKNYNDWETLRVGICANLVTEAPQNVRMLCPSKTW